MTPEMVTTIGQQALWVTMMIAAPLLLSALAADRLEGAGIDRKPRGREKASDHTPVWCELGPPHPYPV